MKPLWPHQERGIRRLREAARGRGPAFGLLAQLPTGGGKTRMALELVASCMAKGHRALWICHRTELLDQPLARCLEAGWPEDNIGICKSGRDEGNPDAALVFASVQTMAARGIRPDARLVVIDEARHFGAPVFESVARHYDKAVRIGLDATPARADGTGIGLFDELVSVATIQELLDGGFLVPARVISDPKEASSSMFDSPLGAYQCFGEKRPALLYAPTVSYAEEQAAQFAAAGIRVGAVFGTTPDEERADIVQRFRDGSLDVLASVDVFLDGVDLPRCSCIILARNVAHEATYVQIVGRAMRKADDKRDAIILDMFGAIHRHGHPHIERAWHLDGDAVSHQADLPPAVQCPQCFAWNPGSRCPHCGAELPPPPPPKITKREAIEIAREAMPKAGDDWTLWLELVSTADERGYKPQWASLRYKAARGTWPRWGLKQARKALGLDDA